VADATGMSAEDARVVAETVDEVGRAVVIEGFDKTALVKVAKKINEIKLVTTVRTVKDTILEYTAGMALEWLKGLGMRGGDEVRGIVCQEMCGVVLGEFHEGVVEVLWDDCRECLVAPGEAFDDGSDEATGMQIDGQESKIPRIRLDQLFALDIKLWKQTRANLKSLFINTMIVDGDLYKRYLGTRFAFNYLDIVDAYLNTDKEYELSISEFAVQLFTVPSISQYD
jgi:hypothetical protein